jgi:hypothetical protein
MFRASSVEDYDTIKCLWKWKCINFVTLLWYIMIHGQQNIKSLYITCFILFLCSAWRWSLKPKHVAEKSYNKLLYFDYVRRNLNWKSAAKMFQYVSRKTSMASCAEQLFRFTCLCNVIVESCHWNKTANFWTQFPKSIPHHRFYE